jgi:uncharacterized integral membrane protein (TIGR00697 family)
VSPLHEAPASDAPSGSSIPRHYRYFDMLLAAFVATLLCCNVIGSGKVTSLGGYTFGAGILFLPMSYAFNVILTEVYGFKRARKAVWAGFGALAFAALMSWGVLALPPAPAWHAQSAYEMTFGSTPRIVAAELLAFFVGELTNAYVLAKLKILTQGRQLWLRAIGSTAVGEALDTLLFYPIAFAGIWEPRLLLTVILSTYVLKGVWQVLATPAIYAVVGFLKRAEGEDHDDRNTRFSPFSLED